MKLINHTSIILLVLIIMYIPNVYSQTVDTTFYGNRKIRSIEIVNEENRILTSFYSEAGENLLAQKTFNYAYFDSAMFAKRTVEVEDNMITREYWIHEQDTIFRFTKFDESFKQYHNSFLKYLESEISYPEIARNNGIQGQVLVRFIVNKNGVINRIKALTRVGFDLEETAVDLLSKYKRWGIITENGKPINCFLVLPLTFRLK